MVYCDYVESRGTKVVYAIGGSTDDITGRLEIDLSDDSFEVTSPPKKSQVYLPHIAAMIRKNLPAFKRGTFKKRCHMKYKTTTKRGGFLPYRGLKMPYSITGSGRSARHTGLYRGLKMPYSITNTENRKEQEGTRGQNTKSREIYRGLGTKRRTIPRRYNQILEKGNC